MMRMMRNIWTAKNIWDTATLTFNIWWTYYEYDVKRMPDCKLWTTQNMKHIPSSWSSWCYDNNTSNCNTDVVFLLEINDKINIYVY